VREEDGWRGHSIAGDAEIRAEQDCGMPRGAITVSALSAPGASASEGADEQWIVGQVADFDRDGNDELFARDTRTLYRIDISSAPRIAEQNEPRFDFHGPLTVGDHDGDGAPSLLCGAALAVLTYEIGRVLFSRRAGFLAALLVSAAPLAWIESRVGTADAALAAALAATFLSTWKAGTSPRPAAPAALAGGALGLGVPVGVWNGRRGEAALQILQRLSV
jgi:hypothetical protein